MKSHKISVVNNAVCDDCGKIFPIDETALKFKRFPDGIQIDYFRCDNCGKVYVYLVTDSELRKDIKRRGFISSVKRMKLRAEELKKSYECGIKDLP